MPFLCRCNRARNQGLLAGFCSAPAVLQLCSPGDWEFITEYRRIANNMRRILFILSTLAVMGAVDVLKQAMKPAAIEHAFGSSHRDSGSRRAVEFNRTRLWRDRPVEEQCKFHPPPGYSSIAQKYLLGRREQIVRRI